MVFFRAISDGFIVNAILSSGKCHSDSAKEWKKHWGGDLCLLDEQDRVHTTIAPLGNRLVILDVSKPNFNKHFVSPVSRAGKNRYSLVGWYSERKPKS